MNNYTKIVKDNPKTWEKLKEYFGYSEFSLNFADLFVFNDKLFEFFDSQGLEGYYFKTVDYSKGIDCSKNDSPIHVWYIFIGEDITMELIIKDYPTRKDIENYLIEKLFYELEKQLKNG